MTDWLYAYVCWPCKNGVHGACTFDACVCGKKHTPPVDCGVCERCPAKAERLIKLDPDDERVSQVCEHCYTELLAGKQWAKDHDTLTYEEWCRLSRVFLKGADPRYGVFHDGVDDTRIHRWITRRIEEAKPRG